MSDDRKKYTANVVAAKLHGLVGSPIELVVGTALFERLADFYGHWKCWVYSDKEFSSLTPSALPPGHCVLALVPQYSIAAVGRVDFAVVIPIFGLDRPLVVVECDGHEFHDRTKEQASKDRKRDRGIVAIGAPVLRFTGTDIMRDSSSAVEEIVEVMHQRAMRQEQQWWFEIGNALNEQPKPAPGLYVPYQWPLMRSDGKNFSPK